MEELDTIILPARNSVLLLLLLGLCACERESADLLNISEPENFAKILYPEDNPTTTAGLALGKALFFDPFLSDDGTVSCATCHRPEMAFTDGRPVSVGINGRPGRRNSPSLTNVGYLHETLFWDGRADDLESQALHPVANPNEMGGSWPVLISQLRKHPDYWPSFQQAFGLRHTSELNPDHVGKALAQYQRSLISANAKYDRVQRGEATYTKAEALGHAIFFDLADGADLAFAKLPTGECAHCHIPPHFTNQQFFNNGLDEAPTLEEFVDKGRGVVTKNHYDNGRFRTPGLRNVALTAPYMHDGRFNSLDEIVAHYNAGGKYAENRSPNIFPLGLTADQAAGLTAFLKTLTDSSFVSNPVYRPD